MFKFNKSLFSDQKVPQIRLSLKGKNCQNELCSMDKGTKVNETILLILSILLQGVKRLYLILRILENRKVFFYIGRVIKLVGIQAIVRVINIIIFVFMLFEE